MNNDFKAAKKSYEKAIEVVKSDDLQVYTIEYQKVLEEINKELKN